MSNWPRITIDVDDGTWLVRSHPEGRILGSGKDGAAAWHSARMRLLAENVGKILSEIPVKQR